MPESPQIIIDSEFQSHMPALRPEERASLESLLVAHGCREALVVWNGTLVDGHNRYEICTRRGIPFRVSEIQFPNREAALEWIDDNQIGRRNLNPDWFRYYLGREYRNKKRTRGGDGSNQHTEQIPQNEGNATAETIAEKHGVGRATVERAATFSEAVDTVADNVGADFRNKVLDGDFNLSQQDVKTIAELEPTVQAEVIEEIAQSESKDHRKIVNERLNPLLTSSSHEWYTPEHIIERARKALGAIDLDPCTSEFANRLIQAATTYTTDDNGLKHKWTGSVWMNPPYGGEIGQWTEKLKSEFETGNVTRALALVPSRTDTAWFHQMRAFPRCFLKGRLKFGSDDGRELNSAPFPCVVIALGISAEELNAAFGEIGDVYVLAEN